MLVAALLFALAGGSGPNPIPTATPGFDGTGTVGLPTADPASVGMSAERLEAGIKMAELRFNQEYADVLRRARDAAGRRTPSGG